MGLAIFQALLCAINVATYLMLDSPLALATAAFTGLTALIFAIRES